MRVAGAPGRRSDPRAHDIGHAVSLVLKRSSVHAADGMSLRLVATPDLLKRRGNLADGGAARAAATARASRLPSPDEAASVSAFKQPLTAASSRLALSVARRSSCAARTAELSTLSTSTGGSLPTGQRFTPMTTL